MPSRGALIPAQFTGGFADARANSVSVMNCCEVEPVIAPLASKFRFRQTDWSGSRIAVYRAVAAW